MPDDTGPVGFDPFVKLTGLGPRSWPGKCGWPFQPPQPRPHPRMKGDGIGWTAPSSGPLQPPLNEFLQTMLPTALLHPTRDHHFHDRGRRTFPTLEALLPAPVPPLDSSKPPGPHAEGTRLRSFHPEEAELSPLAMHPKMYRAYQTGVRSRWSIGPHSQPAGQHCGQGGDTEGGALVLHTPLGRRYH